MSQQVNQRFFKTLDNLIAQGKIKNMSAFLKKHKINQGALWRLKSEPEREFQLSYLSILVSDYGVSATWLLTGKDKAK